MKKLICTWCFVIICCVVHAQQETGIVYTDYGDGLSHRFQLMEEIPPFDIDMDQDGINDWRFTGEEMMHLCIRIKIHPVVPWWQEDEYNRYGISDRYFCYVGDSLVSAEPFIVGDTLSHCSWEYDSYAWREVYYELPDPDFPPAGSGQFPRHFVGTRFQQAEGYCYGWMELSVYIQDEGKVGQYADVTIYRTAYCTVPDYPLRVGQTDFSWTGLDGQGDAAFAILHPNPTSDIVTVSGQDLESAEAFNALGQRIASVKGGGEQLTIDLSGQPAGIYFVKVTDSVGRKCVKKVVKR